MHPPRDLTPQLVEEAQVTYLQATRWMHAEAPFEEVPDAEPAAEPADVKPAKKASRVQPAAQSGRRAAADVQSTAQSGGSE